MTNRNDPAHRLVVNGVALILALTLLGTAALIWFGQPPRQGFAVKEPGGITIYP